MKNVKALCIQARTHPLITKKYNYNSNEIITICEKIIASQKLLLVM